MIKLLLINDTDGRENIGCRLTSNSLKSALSQSFSSQGKQACFVSAPWGFGHKNPPALFEQPSDPRSTFSRERLRRVALAEYGRQALDDLELCDAIIFQPEGTISDRHLLARVVRLFSLPLLAALYTEKPVVCYNGTFPLFTDDRFHFIRWALSKFEYVAGRDRLTSEHYGFSYFPDEAFWWKPVAPAQRESAKPKILLTTIAEAAPQKNRDLIEKMIDYCERKQCIPVVLTKGAEVWGGYKREILSLGGTFSSFAELRDAESIIMQCACHVGGRYHMAIFAASCGTPSQLVRSNTHKNIWLIEDVDGINALPDDILGLDPEQFLTDYQSGLTQSVLRLRQLQSEQRGMVTETILEAVGLSKIPDVASLDESVLQNIDFDIMRRTETSRNAPLVKRLARKIIGKIRP